MTIFGQSITLDPKSTAPASVQVNADLAFRKIQRETANGVFTAYNRQNASVIIFEGGGTINGIADGQAGLVVYIFNGYPVSNATTTSQLTIMHEAGAETNAANRILTPTGVDFNIGAGKGGVMLMYDGSKQRWRVLSVENTGGSSPAGWGLNGNGGTVASNFIGTSDAQSLTFKTGNIERLNLDASKPSLTFQAIGGPSPEIIGRKANGTIAAPTPVSLYSDLLNLKGNGYNGSSYKTGAGIRFESSNPWGLTSTPGRIVFSTQPVTGTDALLDRMTIEENGNVGIGFPATGAKLTVGGAVSILAYGDVITAANTNIFVGGGVSGSVANDDNDTSPGQTRYLNIGPQKTIHRFYGGGTVVIAGDETVPTNDGQIIFVYALSNTSIFIPHNDCSAHAACKKIITNTGSDITINNGGGATLIFDGISDCWRVIGVAN